MDNHENQAGDPGSLGLLAWAAVSVAICGAAILLMPAQPTFDGVGAGAASPAAPSEMSGRAASTDRSESDHCRTCPPAPRNRPEASGDREHTLASFATLTVRLALAAFLAWGGVLCLRAVARDALDGPRPEG